MSTYVPPSTTFSIVEKNMKRNPDNAIIFRYAQKKLVMIIFISRKAIKGTTIV